MKPGPDRANRRMRLQLRLLDLLARKQQMDRGAGADSVSMEEHVRSRRLPEAAAVLLGNRDNPRQIVTPDHNVNVAR